MGCLPHVKLLGVSVSAVAGCRQKQLPVSEGGQWQLRPRQPFRFQFSPTAAFNTCFPPLAAVLGKREQQAVRILFSRNMLPPLQTPCASKTIVEGQMENGQITRLKVTPKSRVKDVVIIGK